MGEPLPHQCEADADSRKCVIFGHRPHHQEVRVRFDEMFDVPRRRTVDVCLVEDDHRLPEITQYRLQVGRSQGIARRIVRRADEDNRRPLARIHLPHRGKIV